ncbi:2'-5' RNA ligase family protein [Labrys sp. KB_33_2]|uniref:2'-5' RNA ligase family protein n=1 Tax=Labrys sp. KB_33_2 TaxID=3237479 RepID=UPI003F8F891C
MSDTLDLFGAPPRRPKRGERLFYTLLPQKEDAHRLGQFARHFVDENHFCGRLLREDRLHVSVQQVGDYRHLKTSLIHAAIMAGDRVCMSAFEATLDSAMCFDAIPKRERPLRYPVVLRGQGSGLFELHCRLGAAMWQHGLRASFGFTPHMTLFYGERPILTRPIEPIHVPIMDFCLVHSRLGLTEYRILKRWPLVKRKTLLH